MLYFPLLLKLYKLVLTFESVDEILKYGHSSDNYRAVLAAGAISS